MTTPRTFLAPSRLFALLVVLSALGFALATACVDGDDEDIDITQDPMDDGKDQVICGAEFEEDLLPFFDTYCNRCHAGDLETEYRNGAPEDLNFDTLDGVLDQPARLRASLLDDGGQPPSAPYPLATERDNMIAWIDCATGEGARE
ncbi:hypothetical protein KDL45_06195 [bacterium]|nr:hypothetical protein [bacterium]